MENEEAQRFVMDVLRECSELSKEQYPCEMYSKEEISEFLENYKEGNRKIAEEYLHEPGAELFDYEVEDLPKWQKDNPYMVDDLIRILGSVMLRVYQSEQKMSEIDQSVWQIKHPIYAICQSVKRKIKRGKN